MYLHLGKDTVVSTENIIGVFDIDRCTVSVLARNYLTQAEKSGCVVNVSEELPRSFVVCREAQKNTVYISPLSPATILKRIQSGLSGAFEVKF